MASIVLYHHACGRTPGVIAFGERLRSAGHTVTVPDLYDGALFDTIDAGVAHAEGIGLGEIADRGVAAAAEAAESGTALVAAGFSLGVLPAQKLAQTVPGVGAVILYHGGVPASVFGDRWPEGIALQFHLSREDEWAEPDVVEALAGEVPGSELFWYPGSEHLVTDSSRVEYHPESTELILERSLLLIDRCEDRFRVADG